MSLYLKRSLVILFMLLIFEHDVQAKHTKIPIHNIWEAQDKPAAGEPESIGTYSNGCMIGATALPLSGYGYQIMRPSRDRFFGQPELIDYITNLSKDVKDKLDNVLMVGDMSLPKGGPFTFGHKSHQIGLDVDLWYEAPEAAKSRNLSKLERDKISAVNVVDAKHKIVNENWGRYQRNLLKLAANEPNVDRIFVNPAIKQELCRSDRGEKWLSRIRPWNGHDDHFHVRLLCPEGDSTCKTPEGYEPIKETDGCDETLAWWFRKPTPEEMIEWLKTHIAELRKPKPKLPASCMKLVGK